MSAVSVALAWPSVKIDEITSHTAPTRSASVSSARWIEGNPCGPDLRLGAGESTRHRLFGHEERTGDLWRREPRDDPQGQRDLCLGCERRVAASDQERELIVEGLFTIEVGVSRLRTVRS